MAMAKVASRKKHQDELKAKGLDAYDTMVYRIVDGQLKSYINDHPEVTTRGVRGVTLRGSIRKRIVGQLTCDDVRAKLAVALGSDSSPGEPEPPNPKAEATAKGRFWPGLQRLLDFLRAPRSKA